MADHLRDGEIVNGKKEGRWVTHYANGNQRSEGEYRSGKKHGRWVLSHKNGTIQSEATFHENLYTGYYCSYHDNGEKFREGHYAPIQGNSSDGRKEGVWHQYNRDGEIDTTVVYKRGRVVERLTEPPSE